MGAHRTCDCGHCRKCIRRFLMAEWWKKRKSGTVPGVVGRRTGSVRGYRLAKGFPIPLGKGGDRATKIASPAVTIPVPQMTEADRKILEKWKERFKE